MAIRVVLAEDHYLVREASDACSRRGQTSRSRLCVATSTSLLAAVEAEQPDVVVTDIRMPPGGADEGIQAAARLRESHPDVGVVVLSQYADPSYALALEHGSARRAYLLKEGLTDIGQLEAAIREVADGGSVIDPKVVDALVARRRAARSRRSAS